MDPLGFPPSLFSHMLPAIILLIIVSVQPISMIDTKIKESGFLYVCTN
jgi:hypothetical protein